MSSLARNRVLVAFVIIAFILTAGLAAIFWARGFKPDFKKGKIERTGLIVATSIPTGAQVYLDDRLTSATDTNIAFLEPKTYKVRIEKDGYTTWTKDIEIKADLAVEIKALLFPTAPEIKPLTTTGSFNPTLSTDGVKIVYGVANTRGGLYLITMSDRPFPFRQDARLLAKNSESYDFSKAKFVWSPDSKQIIARFRGNDTSTLANLLIDSDKTEQQPRDITGALTATLNSWQEELDAKAATLAITLPESVKSATTEANLNQKPAPNLSLITYDLSLNYFPTGLMFSPDEEKVLYSSRNEADKDKGDKYQIFDLRTKKSFTLPDLPDLLNLSWHPDSNHLIVTQKDLISIIETDGGNLMTIYSGKFENGFVYPHPSGTRLIILTTLTQQEGNPPNLYSINLR